MYSMDSTPSLDTVAWSTVCAMLPTVAEVFLFVFSVHPCRLEADEHFLRFLITSRAVT